jgi:hypothetical protein
MLRHVDHRLQAVAAAAVPAIVLVLMVMRHAVHRAPHRTGRLWILLPCSLCTHIKAAASCQRVTTSFVNLSVW